MKLQHFIAMILVFLLGAVSLIMGTLVLLGIHEAGHVVLKGLLVYNIVLGALSLLVAYLIWNRSRSTSSSVLLLLLSHISVLIFLVLFTNHVAKESIRAMEIRAIIWALVFLLIQWGSFKKSNLRTRGWRGMAVLLGATTIILHSCKNNPNRQSSDSQSNPDQVQVEEASPNVPIAHDAWINEIQLDHGSKWLANAETTLGVSKMLTALNGFNGGSVSAYQALGDDLNDLKNTIVKECTMTGPSHDNLHVWLHPLIEKIEALQNTDSEASGVQRVHDIEQHLNGYYEFFE
jgi:hypothetical protein